MPEYYANPMSGDPRIQQSMLQLGDMLANGPQRQQDAIIAGRQAGADLSRTNALTAQAYSGVRANDALARQRGADAALDERKLEGLKLMEAAWSDPTMPVNDRLGKARAIVAGYGLGPEDVEAYMLATAGLAELPEANVNQYVTMTRGYQNTPEFHLGEPTPAFDPGSNEFTFARRDDLVTGGFKPVTSLDQQKARVFSFLSPEAQDSTVMGLNDLTEIVDENGETIYAPEYLAMGEKVPQDPADAPKLTSWVEGNETVQGYYDPTDPRANAYGLVEISRGPRTGRAGEIVQSATDQVFSADDAATLETALAAGQDADARIQEIDRTMALLRAGTPSGFWTDVTLPVRQALVGAGFGDEQRLGEIETLTADLGNRVMDRIQETKGAVSNAEMDYFRKISASIGKTPYGNMLLLEGERRAWARAAKMRAYAQTLRGRPPVEISAALEEFRQQNPLWAPEELENIQLMAPDQNLGYSGTDPFGDLDIGGYLD